ncbi:hypothetical protein JD844_003272 [Phrynosoma platyrhinos]|uniref:Macrophage mannose receptor 1-like n=1 Tax=Phrynosoma platyrhinos TaxID=52577 RepID=A0ABQ7TDL0_PHRPL|nr:hypothetical protein JD844_003272 [Phrynosoma platyrhinos]
MSAILLFTFLFLITPAFQVSEPDTFLIHNEYLRLCMEAQKSHSITLESCNKDNEWQNFKWASEDLILNMATKLCLAAPSKTNLVSLTLSPCNKTSELQKWACRNESLLELGKEKLFLQPASGQKENVIVSKASTTKSTWTIYGTKDSLCSKGYEALFTLGGNSFGNPCVFPFKYRNTWHAKCITDDDETAQLWCGTTEDVDKDSLKGYCPVKDDNEFFWMKNQWTGDLYQFNSHSALTWHEARQSCEQQNAELLSITELHEQTYLTGLTSVDDIDYWIGLNSLDFDSGWEWTGDHPLRYLNWAPGNPSPESEKICGSMQSGNDPLKPIKCQDGWIAYAGYCYHLHRGLKTWKDALSFCRKADGDLISIHNIEEYSFVISQLGYKSTDFLWIGLNDQKTQMYFEWSDGTSVRFTKWQRGEPTHVNNRQEDCVIMSGENGDWADHYCEEELGYICKGKPLASAPEEAEPDDPSCQKVDFQYGYDWSSLYSDNKPGCKVIYRYYGSWITFLCETLRKWICQIKRGRMTQSIHVISFSFAEYSFKKIEDGWISYGSNEYYLSNITLPAEKAQEFCRKHGGGLTIIETETERKFLWKYNYFYGSFHSPYIGLILGLDGKFSWIDGSPVTYVSWSPNQPDFANEDENCVVMYSYTGNMGIMAAQTCFRIYGFNEEERKNWSAARADCKNLGGNLASIPSKRVQAFLTMHLKSSSVGPWIGLNDRNLENQFLWTDGSGVYYTNWSPGAPRYHVSDTCKTNKKYKWISNQRLVYTSWGDEEPKENIACVYLDIDGHWKTSTCNETYFTICEKYHGIIPTDPPEVPGRCPESKESHSPWIPFRAHCYSFYPFRQSWPSASMRCAHLGGTLTSIEDSAEMQFLLDYTHKLNQRDFWIGLFKNVDGEWEWEDKTEVDFVNWKDGPPEAYNYSYYHDKGYIVFQEQCIFMDGHTGEWFGQWCYSYKGFICKTSKIIEEPTKKPTDSKEHMEVLPSVHGIAVIAVILVMLILTGAGITAYIFYKRRSIQPQTTGGFENSMYNGDMVTLQKDPECQMDKKEGE